jgi:hypothetical protein
LLDVRAVYGAGSTSKVTVNTIPNGDLSVVAGVPIDPSASLVSWGVQCLATKHIQEAYLNSQDQWDPINGDSIILGGSSIIDIFHKWNDLPYKLGQRIISVKQTANGLTNGYTIDWYPKGPVWGKGLGDWGAMNNVTITQLFGAALTAQAWGSQGLAPTTAIPNGKYAILGAWVNALTNYALLRFSHADFGAYRPGFPVIDQANVAAALIVIPKDPLLLNQGYQFCYGGAIGGNKPNCPVFTVSNAGTGLTLEMLSCNADTPNVVLNLAKVG